MLKKRDKWKRQVLADIKRNTERKKQKKREAYRSIYNSRKTVEFKTSSKLNMSKLFFMPKLKSKWSDDLTKNAIAIYPVLCSRADFREKRHFQLSRDNIAKLAGVSPVSVDKGVQRLEQIYFNDQNGNRTPLLERKKIQDGQRRYWTYLAGFYRFNNENANNKNWESRSIVFHTCIIESGVWAGLSGKAKALYLAMRTVSRFDRDLYEEIESIRVHSFDEIYTDELDEEGEKNAYKQRKWELSDTSLKSLFELANIPYKETRQIVSELEGCGLIERLHKTNSVFQVWLRPKHFMKNMRRN